MSPSFKAYRPGRAFRCGHTFETGDLVYMEEGVSGYVCSACASLYPKLKQEQLAATTPETTLNQSIPLDSKKPLESASTLSREQRIASMHVEKMLLLAEIAEQLRAVAVAEQQRNAMLAANYKGEHEREGKQ